MSEEKLTVAELLARANKTKSADSAPRRRRRRSLEEGGISVAELTGSIPRVEAEGPRRGAHALKSDAEEFDQEREDVAAAQPAVETAETVVEADGAGAAEESAAADAVEETPAADSEAVEESAAEPEAESEHSELDDVAKEAAQAAETQSIADSELAEGAEGFDSAEGSQSSQGADGVEAAEDVEGAAAAAVVADAPEAVAPQGQALPVVVPRSPRPVLFNEERSEITYTFTDLRDVENTELSVGEPGPVAREVLEGSLSYDDRPTASIPVVAEAAEAPAETATSAVVAEAVAEPAAAEPDVVEPDVVEPAVEDADATEEKDDSYAEDNSLSITLLIIQVFVGLLVGALVFLGFTLAWERLPKVVSVLLAVVVTGLFVLSANFLRRERDVVTPILAGIVGLALTFGPWALFSL